MLDSFTLLLQPFVKNPILGGSVTLMIAGVVGFALTKLPKIASTWFIKLFTISLEFDNSGRSSNRMHFISFVKWHHEKKMFKWTRQFKLDESVDLWSDGETDGIIMGSGLGFHLFIYHGRIFWFIRSKLDSRGTDREKQEIKLVTFGKNFSVFNKILNEFKYSVEKNSKRHIHVFNDGWDMLAIIPERKWETVILNRQTKSKLENTIKIFLESKEWYRNRGIPYKLVIMLHGKPGTGKTSIIKALAHHFNRHLCMINLSQMSDSSFVTALTMAPASSIVTLEDFDTSAAVTSRDIVKEESKELNIKMLSLSTILNTLDGLAELDGQIIIMTTNHPEKLDTALIRKGRVDHTVELGYLNHEEIVDYIELAFEKQFTSVSKFKAISGADLQSLFIEHKESLPDFVNAIPVGV